MDASTIPKTDYSRIAKYYDKVRLVPAGALLSRIIECGRIDRSSAIMDLGCGTGRFTLRTDANKTFYDVGLGTLDRDAEEGCLEG